MRKGFMPPAKRSAACITGPIDCPRATRSLEAFVFGARAAASAAEAVQRAPAAWDEKLAQKTIERLGLVYENSRSAGVAPITLQN